MKVRQARDYVSVVILEVLSMVPENFGVQGLEGAGIVKDIESSAPRFIPLPRNHQRLKLLWNRSVRIMVVASTKQHHPLFFRTETSSYSHSVEFGYCA